MLDTWWRVFLAALKASSFPAKPRRAILRRRDFNRPMLVCALERRDLLAGFTPGNLVVNTVGTGATLDGSATVVMLREYGLDNLNTPTAATLVNSVVAPSSNAGNNSGNLTDSGSAGSNGALNLSVDGSQVTLLGYDAPESLANVASTTSSANNRSIGYADASGTLTVGPRLTDAYSGTGNNPRAAVSVDGSTFWTGGNPGVRYVGTNAAVATTSTPLITSSPPNTRFVTIATDRNDKQFLIGNSAATVFVWPTATLPTTASAQQSLSLTGLGSDLGEVVMLDRSASIGATGLGGIDTIYVTNGQGLTSGSIAKFEWNGSAWISRSSRTYTNGLNGLTARVTDSGDVQLFVTTRLSSGNNQLLTRTDTSAFGSDISLGSFTVLATSGAGYGFRGVSFTPDEATPGTLAPGAAALANAGGAPVNLLGDVSWNDGSTFNGGSLTISGAATGDAISIADVPGQITTSGNSVLFNGTPIGLFSGGTDTTPFHVDFNSRNDVNRVSKTMVEQLLEQLQFSTNSNATSRSLNIKVDQAAGQESLVTSFMASQTIAINQPPSQVQLVNVTSSVAENTNVPNRLKVADISVSDDSVGGNILGLNGVDAGAFEIVGQELYLKAGTVLNFEVKNSYSVTVTVDDPAVGSTPDASVNFTLNVTDVNEPPSIGIANAVMQLREDTQSPTPRKMADIIVSDDALGSATRSLSGPDASFFDLIGPELYLKAGTVFDFETKSSYTVNIDLDDPDLPNNPDARATLTLQILDVAEPPEIEVKIADVNVADGSTVDYGSAETGAVVSRIFSVTNTGDGVLTLQPAIITGSDFSLSSSNFTAGQTLARNETVTFTIDMSTATASAKTGTVTFLNDDPDEGVYDISLSGTITDPVPEIHILDDGDAGFSLTGSWETQANGYGGDIRAVGGSDGSRMATWTFTGLPSGTYQLDGTWTPGGDRASNAPYVLRDGVGGPIVSAFSVNQRNTPSGARSDGGRPFAHLDTVTVTNGTLVVQLTNTATNGAIFADALRLERLLTVPSAPRLAVRDGPTAVWSSLPVNLGTTPLGSAALTKTFTVRNTGTADLVLQPITLTGSGWALLSPNFTAGQVLAPEATVDITVALSTGVVGTFGGTLSFGHNAGGPFTLPLSGTITALDLAVVDDGDAGFSLTGSWETQANGYGGDIRAVGGSDGSRMATWTFTGLPSGTYQLDGTWTWGGDRASNAPYVLRDGVGGPILSAFSVNQRNTPSGARSDGGRPFAHLDTVTVTNGTLVVQLTNTATNGAIFADALRLERLLTVPSAPRLAVRDGAAPVWSSLPVNLGTTPLGSAALTKTFTVRNTGTADLVLQPITLTGSGWALLSPNFTAGQVLAPEATVDITVALSTGVVGTFGGTLSFGHNAGGPFTLPLSGTITALDLAVVDDGDAGFSLTGSWETQANGYGGDIRAVGGSDGSRTATWTFTGLPSGTYQLDGTWTWGGDRASNAPYVLRDGVGGPILSAFSVNQRNTPSGARSDGGRPFAHLDTVTVTNGTLVVQLTNTATNGAIFADALRIERIV